MAINKEKSPTWYKVVVWVVLIAFVLGFVVVGIAWIFNGGGSNLQDPNATASSSSSQESTATAQVNTINGRYQAQVTAALKEQKSKPNDFTANSNLGLAYFLWAQELTSANTAESLAAATPRYSDALPYLKTAYEQKPTDANVATSYIQALAFSGDQTQAITIARAVTAKTPSNAEAWYILGALLSNSSEKNAKADAIAALRMAIEKDTSGTLKASAQQEIDTLNKAQ